MSTASADGRERLLAQVWGPPDARERAKQLIKAGGSAAGFGALFQGCESCGAGLDFEGALIVLVVGLVAAGLWWMITFVWRNIEAYRHRLRPRGATKPPAKLARSAAHRGRVRGGATTILSAASESPCRAYGIELLADRHQASAVMLRHAHAAPLEIELDDGSLLEVPAGRLRIAGPSQRIAASDSQLQGYLNLPEVNDDDLEPVPFDAVDETVVVDGDQVDIYGELEREPLESESNYRSARWRYRPVGPITLKLVRS